MTKTEQDLITFAKKLQSVLHSKTTHTVRIIPPDKISNETWETPWNIARYKSSKKHIECLYSWQQLATAYTKQDPVAWNNISHGIKQNSLTKLTTNQTTRIKMECYYNKLNLFEWSKYIYLLIFIVNLICMLLNTNIFIQVRKIMHCALLIGSLLHGIGICIRSYIMMRPPVATLYESILFVGYIAVVFTLILEIKRKDYSGIFIGSIVGTLLQYIGTRYATDGDTMGMLSAVLNTNFWLTTHVLTISVGYSSCFITGGFGHFYLLTKLLNSKNTLRLDTILKNMLAMGLIALFFSLLGTILGGIWADQSWGRFWGWDPKENGAMLIVLWLTLLLHGRIAKLLSPAIFAVGMILTNIVVVLAWFGVNLLNVGLHSYGFTQNVGINIVTFCGIEILFIIMILICSHIKQQSSFWKNTQPNMKNTTA